MGFSRSRLFAVDVVRYKHDSAITFVDGVKEDAQRSADSERLLRDILRRRAYYIGHLTALVPHLTMTRPLAGQGTTVWESAATAVVISEPSRA